MGSMAHKMAVELEVNYLSTREAEIVSPEIDMDLLDDGNRTNIVYTTGSQNRSNQERIFEDRRGM
jgi:hypothetical protein